MDSALEALDRKGNLSQALALYNPLGAAEQVVHFTPYAGDVRYSAQFAERRIEIVPFVHAPVSSRARIVWGLPRSIATVVTTLRRRRVNVIRGRLPYFGSLIGCLAGRWLDIPTVVSLGGDHRLAQRLEGKYYFGSRWLSYGIERAVLRLCDVIIVPNEYTRRYVGGVIGERRAAAKTEVIAWAITPHAEVRPEDLDATLATLGVDPSTPYVLIAGHLNPYKFANEMFEVAAEVLRRRPGRVAFIFCGDGPLRAEGERRLGLLRDAHLVGWQPNTVVRQLMSRAIAVAIPMSGFVLLEAAAAASVVLTSNVEWHSELVDDGVSGWLADPRDVATWADRLCDALDHRDRVRPMGQRLYDRFAERYLPEVVLGQEASVYRRLLERRAAEA